MEGAGGSRGRGRAESRSLLVLLHQAFALCHPGLGCGPSLCEVPSQGNEGRVLPVGGAVKDKLP